MVILNFEALGVAPPDAALTPGGVAGVTPGANQPSGLFASLVAAQTELLKLANNGEVVAENAAAAEVSEETLAQLVNGQPDEDGGEETAALFTAFGGKPDSPPGHGVRVYAHALVPSGNDQHAATKAVSSTNVTQVPPSTEGGQPVASTEDGLVEQLPLESRVNVVKLPSRAAPQTATNTTAAPVVTPEVDQALSANARDGTAPQAQTVDKPNARVVQIDSAAQVIVTDGDDAAPLPEAARDAQARATRAQQAVQRPQPQQQATVNLADAEPAEHVARPILRTDAPQGSETSRLAISNAQAVLSEVAANMESGQQQGQSANAGQSGGQLPAPPGITALSGDARAFEAAMAKEGPVKADAPTATMETVAPKTVQHVRMMVTNGNSSMRVRLVPAHLGELHIVVESTPSGVQIDLSATSREVRDQLEGQINVLREQLARDGVEVNRINVGTESASQVANGSASNRQGPQMDNGSRQGSFTQRNDGQSSGDPPPDRRQREHAPSAGSQSLNVYA